MAAWADERRRRRRARMATILLTLALSSIAFLAGAVVRDWLNGRA
jgi:hypothetical protein